MKYVVVENELYKLTDKQYKHFSNLRDKYIFDKSLDAHSKSLNYVTENGKFIDTCFGYWY